MCPRDQCDHRKPYAALQAKNKEEQQLASSVCAPVTSTVKNPVTSQNQQTSAAR